jgi:cullin-5
VNLCSNPEDRLLIYRDNFEKAYIQATEAFYKAKAPEFLRLNGVEDYMKYAETKLKEEEMRARKYLESCGNSVQLVSICFPYNSNHLSNSSQLDYVLFS